MANMGTPLMWAGMLHLLFGNFVIGLLEGLLLARLCRLNKWWSVGVMIAANYFSAWIGTWVLKFLDVNSVPVDLHNIRGVVILMIAIAYVLTLLLELPFIAFSLRKDPQWLRKSIRSSLIIQTLSYVLLCGWYGSASRTSLLGEIHVVPPSEVGIPSAVRVIFIAEADGKVCELDLETGARTHIPTLPARADSLLTRLGTAERSPWDRDGTYYPGLKLENRLTKQEVRITFETPFGLWRMGYATLLPGDILLFQLGSTQICAFNPATKRIALLAKGRSPSAVLRDASR